MVEIVVAENEYHRLRKMHGSRRCNSVNAGYCLIQCIENNKEGLIHMQMKINTPGDFSFQSL